MAEALGAPRCANALLCYNNYSARRSVPGDVQLLLLFEGYGFSEHELEPAESRAGQAPKLTKHSFS